MGSYSFKSVGKTPEQRTKIDKKINIEAYNKSNSDIGIQDSTSGDPSILLKSDKIRVVGRKDVQIIVKDDNGEDTTSVSAKSDGSITVKSKNNFTLKIDKDGKVNLDANGDVVINPGPGLIKLGGEGANNAVLCQTAGKPIIGSMGTAFGGGGTFGVFSSKVRVI
ncbi:MAG: hypothetical protein FJZ43_04760 [Candidatus Staskawiczbacteria bacterium]|nr:hypothetical protein [Candidatus Staskawiczbacteria bacterium]